MPAEGECNSVGALTVCAAEAKAGRRNGDAFLRKLVAEHHAALVGFLRRRLADPTDADDLAQDVYCRIAGRRGVAVEAPRAYLFRAAKNALTDHARRREAASTAGFVSIGDAAESALACSAPTPDRCAEDRERLALVEAAIAALPEKCRIAFVLVRFEERPYKEVAARLGVSVKMIEYYVRQALVEIRRRVDDANGDAAYVDGD